MVPALWGSDATVETGLAGPRAAGIYEVAGCVLLAVGVIVAVYASADAAAGPMPRVLSSIALALGVIVSLLRRFT